eukprot:729710_1
MPNAAPVPNTAPMPNAVKISKKKIDIKYNVVKMYRTGANTTYGGVKIKSNGKYIYRWQIKITATNYQWFAFSFGIDSSNKEFSDDDFSLSGPYGNTNKFYAFGCTGKGKTGFKYCNTVPPNGKKYGEAVELCDTVTIVLNS